MAELGEGAHEGSRRFFKKHRITKYVAEISLKTAAAAYFFMQEGPKGLKHLTDPEELAGLIEGAVIAAKLYHPDSEGQLKYSQAGAGQWVSYDFNRTDVFPSAAKKDGFTMKREGKLFGLMPDEIKDATADTHTSLDRLKPFSMDHLLTFNSFGPAELVAKGLLVATTYRNAYRSVGLEHYEAELGSRMVVDDSVYQVTPKGNGLLHLIGTGGEASPKQEPELSFNPILGLRPA